MNICRRELPLLLTLLLLGWPGAATDLQAQRSSSNTESIEIQEQLDLLAEYSDDGAAHHRLAKLLQQEDRRDEALDHFEAAIRADVNSPSYCNAYRMTCIWWEEQNRSIDFFEDMVDENQDNLELRLHLALAYVDKMPSSMLGIVGQGLLSNKSISQLTKIIEKDSSNWSAVYARAMNHLHWPRAMRHAPDAVADFELAIAIEKGMNLSRTKPVFERSYTGLGDALLKDKRHDEARTVWREGLRLYPKSSGLRKRLSIEDNEELEQFMKQARRLNKQIDTDMSAVWAP